MNLGQPTRRAGSRGLPHRGAARARRHGRGLPGARRAARPARGAQAARAGVAGDERLRERLLRESRLAASLDHPNVIPIYEAGEGDGRLFIAMRYVAGRRPQGAAAARGSARSGACDRDRVPGRRRARRRAPARPRAPRRQAEQRPARPPGRSRALLSGRLRAHPERLRARPGRRPVHGHDRLRRAGADPRRAARRPRRPVRPRLPAVRVPDGHGAVSPAVRRRGALRPPRGTGAGRVRARGGPAARARRGARARHGEATRRSATRAAPRSSARLGRRSASAPPRAGETARAAGAARRRRAGRRGARRSSRCCWAAERPRPPPPTGELVRVDAQPRTRSPRARRSPAIPASWRSRRAGSGWPTSAAATCGATSRPPAGWSGSRRTASRATWRSLGDKVYVGADGRFLSGIVSRYDAVTGVREDGIDLLACAMAAGEGVVWAAGCPLVQRLSTGDGRLRKLVERVPAVPVAGDGRELARAVPRAGDRRRARCGCSGDALDRRLWRLDARTGRVRGHDRARLPADVRRRGRREGLDHGRLQRPVVPLDVATGRLLAPVPRRPRRLRASPPARGAVWVVNTLDGTLSRLDPSTRRVVATIDVGGAPRGVAAGDGAIWVTAHA